MSNPTIALETAAVAAAAPTTPEDERAAKLVELQRQYDAKDLELARTQLRLQDSLDAIVGTREEKYAERLSGHVGAWSSPLETGIFLLAMFGLQAAGFARESYSDGPDHVRTLVLASLSLILLVAVVFLPIKVAKLVRSQSDPQLPQFNKEVDKHWLVQWSYCFMLPVFFGAMGIMNARQPDSGVQWFEGLNPLYVLQHMGTASILILFAACALVVVNVFLGESRHPRQITAYLCDKAIGHLKEDLFDLRHEMKALKAVLSAPSTA
jgi:hypothetical protein